MKNVQIRSAKSKYLEVSEIGTEHHLSFSSQLTLGNTIIALDGIRKCLLVLATNEDSNKPYFIDLDNVAAVTVKKSYGSIKQGALNSKGIEEFLEKIDLEFKFKNNDEPYTLSFFDRERDEESDRLKLDRNAKNWQLILSKMVGSKNHERRKSYA